MFFAPPPEAPPEQVVVTATRTEARASQVSASLTVITRKTIDECLPADAADLFSDEPDMVAGSLYWTQS